MGWKGICEILHTGNLIKEELVLIYKDGPSKVSSRSTDTQEGILWNFFSIQQNCAFTLNQNEPLDVVRQHVVWPSL